MGADWDMPLAKLFDGSLGLFKPNWGRYLLVKAEK
jgi:hypothetical protein